MKRNNFIFFVLLFTSPFLSAQQFSIQPVIGFGSSQTKDEKKSKQGRILIGIKGYYNINNQVASGLEFSSAGSFTNSLGGNSTMDYYDPVTNIKTVDVSNMKADMILAKLRYYVHNSEKKARIFTELGMGMITLYDKVFDMEGVEEKKIKSTQFAVQPEIGLAVSLFQFSLQYTYGGKTPAFTYINEEQMNVHYIARKVSSFYFCGGLKFNF